MRNSWLASTLASWIAAVAVLAGLTLLGSGDPPSVNELPLALSATLALHVLACGILFEPALRAARRLGIPGLGPLLLIGLSGLVLLTFIAAFGGRPSDLTSPEAVVFAGFFITGAVVFGLIRRTPGAMN